MLERIGISLEDNLLEKFDRLIDEKGYENRSEAIRDLIREQLVAREWSEAGANEVRVAVVTLVYGHDSSRAREIVRMGESLVSTKGVKYGRVVPATTGQELT